MAEKWLARLLRVNAVILMLAFPAVLLPAEWMAGIHERLGLGELPRIPLVGYLTRSVSAIYGLFGVATWILASDVRRFWPLVSFWGISCIICGPILLAIDLIESMPLFWTSFEGPYLFAVGCVMVLLQRKMPSPTTD